MTTKNLLGVVTSASSIHTKDGAARYRLDPDPPLEVGTEVSFSGRDLLQPDDCPVAVDVTATGWAWSVRRSHGAFKFTNRHPIEGDEHEEIDHDPDALVVAIFLGVRLGYPSGRSGWARDGQGNLYRIDAASWPGRPHQDWASFDQGDELTFRAVDRPIPLCSRRQRHLYEPGGVHFFKIAIRPARTGFRVDLRAGTRTPIPERKIMGRVAR